MPRRKSWWIVPIWLWATCVIAAQPSLPRYDVYVWTSDKGGLPANSVISLAQSKDGYLWLGTLNGLARFDGSRFVVFDESNTPGLRNARIVKVHEDSRGRLWLGTIAGEIIIVERGGKVTVTRLQPGMDNPEARLASVAEDSFGGVWLYTADGQLGRYLDGRMKVLALGGRARPSSRTLAFEGDYLWVATEQALLGIHPPRTANEQPTAAYSIPLRSLDLIMTSRTGGYWRFAEGRIQKYTRDRLERDLGPYPWRREVLVSCACEDDQGNLVVGTEGAPGDAAFWFSADGRSRQIQGLAHSSVFAVLADREGSLWLGTDGGLNRVKRQMFEALPGTEGSTVQSVCADAKGGLWVGYNSDRIDYWNGDTIGHFSVQSPPVAVAVRSVFVDDRQHVWSGTLAGGLFQFLNGAFVQDGAFAEVGNNWVSCIHQSRDGALWTGTQGGLVRFKDGQWRTFGALDGLSAPKVQVITEDSAGNLWIGTDGGGLNCLRDGKVTVFNKTNGLPSDNISALLADGDGSLWVGTSGGLARHRAGKWSAFTTRDGLAGNSVAYLLDDTRGYMWIGSNGGLMRAAKSALHAYADRSTNTLVIRSYGPPEGVPAREASQGSQPAACRTVDGWLWFATIKGLAGVNPANISINSNPPPVVIEAVFVDGRPVGTNTLRSEPPHMLRVPARREALDVHYASLNLGSPEKARVRYRLEDHEAKWTEALGNRGVAHYSKLPPGDYTFHLQAANEDDVWNLQGAQLAVTVLPPFWRTWWFIGLVAVSTIAGIAAVVHYLSTQKLQRQVALLRQQEALERERARIARDLHDQLGANLTQVALLGEMAEADKNLPAEVEDHAKQIAQTARETTRALDEIVWTVNPANDTLDGLLNYICKYAEDYLAMAGLRYRLEVPRELPDILIAPDLRHNVFLVAKEAINNIVKHAHASSVWLRLKLETGQFILEIQDDGRGLPADAGQKGRSGLKNMRARMADVAGKFEVGRAPDGGTMVRLAAPLQPAGIISEHVTQT